MPKGVAKNPELKSQRISDSLKKNPVRYWLGKKRSPEDIEKFRKSHLGKKQLPETIEKRRLKLVGHRNFLPDGFIPWNKGIKGYKTKPCSEERKQKQKIKMLGRYDKEKHPQWQGGKSFEIYPMDWTRSLRISIRERDKYICQLCNEKQENEAFCIHHIDYNKKNCDPKNLITLCRNCHAKTNTKREHWIKYFNSKFILI